MKDYRRLLSSRSSIPDIAPSPSFPTVPVCRLAEHSTKVRERVGERGKKKQKDDGIDISGPDVVKK